MRNFVATGEKPTDGSEVICNDCENGQKLYISGGNKLNGEIELQGAKNSVLPIIAATVLMKSQVVLKGCPKLSDSFGACRILTHLGAKCAREGDTIIIDASGISVDEIPASLMKKMRSSIIFLGAVLGRLGTCRVSMPGGCEIGERPIDMHVHALEAMGVDIKTQNGIMVCDAPSGVTGAQVTLYFPSVGATENIILAAVLADGTTEIKGAAKEPEIVDLANFLIAAGAKISGAGSDKIVIHGVQTLHEVEYRVMPDRIAAATYLAAAAATRGSIVLRNASFGDLGLICDVFKQTGCKLYAYDNIVAINAESKNLAAPDEIRTGPFPAFPTDAQPIMLAYSVTLPGTTVFYETVFENRFMHVPELRKLGADVKLFDNKTAVVTGKKRMSGAALDSPDLRGGAALVIGALAADGNSTVSNLQHIDRGYENFAENLRKLGGNVYRK
ncbi:MAG: UDP-N-acetylglucosamine 1-carboxyvinyltransferase [Oscillospiraceae bacterium]|jgi:UDP-N-acetylglucosamine 1-carboxyvinyltransferase|nr:UDP-N-acetylglucosamine 1-carboxyvinyltransferase [Oscillospiraceae bacterium]